MSLSLVCLFLRKLFWQGPMIFQDRLEFVSYNFDDYFVSSIA